VTSGVFRGGGGPATAPLGAGKNFFAIVDDSWLVGCVPVL
jgi:hypothetical protein